MSFLMFYFSYLFSVLFLGFLVIFISLMYLSSLFYIKYLIVLVYMSGIVIFILYISCLCWQLSNSFFKSFVLLGIFVFLMYDLGLYSKFVDMGDYFWMFMFFSFLFNSLVMSYSLNLFKVSGSLRF